MKESHDRQLTGSVPSWLKIEHRSDGIVRLRIQTLGQLEAIVDLDDTAVRDLIANLVGRDV